MAGNEVGAFGQVGRDAQLERIDETLAQLASGSFRVMAVRGEPGVGKTLLLTELADRAQARSLAVFRGRATEFEQQVPFSIFIDALEPLAASQKLDAELADALAVLTATNLGEQRAGFDRYRLFREIRRLLEQCAGTVLILDDLHWADPASLELTQYLLRRPPRVPLLIAIAHRTSPPPPGLADALARLGSSATQLVLGPLDPAGVAELFPHLPARRRQLLHQATGGNPLYLRSLADADEQTLSTLVGQAVDDRAAPERMLLDVISTELLGLDPLCRQVVQAAAVAGDPVDPELVAWVAGLPPERAAAAFDELSGIGVLVAEGPRFRFRHPLIRAAGYWTSAPAWRTAAHGRCANFLRDRRGPLMLLAHHTERSAQPGDLAAVDTLTAAATAARHPAPATSARLTRRALQLLPDQPEFATRRAELRMLLARTLGLSGELDESRRLLHEVIQAGGPHRAEAVTFSAVVCRLLGQLDEARALLTNELDRLPDKGEQVAQAHVELAGVDMLRLDAAGIRYHAGRALDALVTNENTALEATAHALLALGFLQDNNTGDAGEHIEQAGWLLDATTDDLLLTELTTIAPLAWVELHVQLPDRAERHLGRGIDLAVRSGLTHSMPYLLIVAACLRTRRGELTEAIAAAEEAGEYSRLMRAGEASAMADIVRLRPTLWHHGQQAALQLADRVDRSGRRLAGWWSGLARLNLAEVYLAAGRFELCLGALEGIDADKATAAEQWALRAVATAGLGRLRDAAHHAAESLSHAMRAGLSHHLGVAHHAHARVLLAADDPDAAAAAAATAVHHFADAEVPVTEGIARHLLAVLYARTGQRQEMQLELGRAKALYAASSATWLSGALARDELRFAARLPRPRQPGLGVLTAREREVVDLVTAGLTNREIAERLYVSPKTVETHLSRAFAKLDVRSRVDLARRVGGG